MFNLSNAAQYILQSVAINLATVHKFLHYIDVPCASYAGVELCGGLENIEFIMLFMCAI